jgi:hypothetical protein
MVNSLAPIKLREYYLYSDDKTSFLKHHYQESFLTNSLIPTLDIHPLNQVQSFIDNQIFIDNFITHLKVEPEIWFWNNATAELKQSLLFSFFLRYHKNHKKVPNVETVNWQKLTLFKNIHDKILKESSITNLPDVPAFFSAIIRSTGKHHTNLRLGHIHLTIDILNNRKTHCIHWDTSVVDLDSNIIDHWIHDDMPS